MSQIEQSEIIDELKNNIASRDAIKAEIVLSHLDDLNGDTQRRIFFELNRSDDSFVIHLLAAFLDKPAVSEHLLLELNNILVAKLMEHPAILMSFLQDPKIEDKIKFIRLAGNVQCTKSAPLIANLLRNNLSREMNIACITALGNIGLSESTGFISDYLYSGDYDLTQAAISALKELNTPDAISRLSERIGTDEKIDRIIIDALAELQTHQAIEHLNALLTVHNAFSRNYAKDKLVAIGSKAVPILLENLKSDDGDLLIHTLNVLGLISDSSAVQPIRQFLFNEPENANARFAAYEALGQLPLKKGAFILTAGLNDSEPQVHIAAAKALEKYTDPIILSGILNLIADGPEAAYRITRAFIDAGSENIITNLISNDSFKNPALKYLIEDAHPETKKYFVELMKKTGYQNLAETVIPSYEEKTAGESSKIYVVDDSRMILRIFKSSLYELGYDSQLFEFPESVLDLMKTEKPGLLITDLNMPGMTGIELTRKVREIYSAEELPILMVTTQQDAEDRDAAFTAGINALMFKPFTTEQLKTQLSNLKI